MKKAIIIISIIAILLSVQISQFGMAKGEIFKNDNQYTYILTADGNEWAIYKDEDFQVNEKVIVMFNNMNTKNVFDDEIIYIMK